jgi:hypothetical protein
MNNTTAIYNTATGVYALNLNTTGSYNTATGVDALELNSTGAQNTATGWQALLNNTGGSYNTADGVNALAQNTSGDANLASGFRALWHNTRGLDNTASGANAMANNSTGSINTASGYNALGANTAGYGNSAFGVSALYNNNGTYNIAIGLNAGFNLTTGTQNIDVGNRGVGAESNTIRIGTQGTQTATFIAGISGTGVTGPDVVVNSNGQLGIVKSSARFKRDVHDMGATSAQLMRLRPVTFVYKSDPQGIRQYGLVAEEVERVYPELVTYDAGGKIETVRYSMLTSMLLNELQKQNRENQRQEEQMRRLSTQLTEERASRKREIEALRNTFAERLAVLERAMGKPIGGRLAAAFEK